jgi:hypothetical protein
LEQKCLWVAGKESAILNKIDIDQQNSQHQKIIFFLADRGTASGDNWRCFASIAKA